MHYNFKNIKIKRIDYIDFLRGFAMLLCMLGHTNITDYFRGYIYSYHMPLFFIITGMVYKQKASVVEFIKRKVKELLVPYYFWSFVWLVFWAILYFAAQKLGIDNGKEFSITNSFLGIILCTRGERFGGYLWFLLALFGTIIFFDFLQRIGNKTMKIAIVAILLISESIYLYNGAPPVPCCIDIIPIASIFVFIGMNLMGGGTYCHIIRR